MEQCNVTMAAKRLTESQSRTLSASFETERIKVLQDERVAVQKRTFTKWINSYLGEAHMQVRDLFVDLADGSKLMKLVEVLAGARIGKPNRGLLRVHKIENVSRVLKYLSLHVTLENIGAEDIVDGNPRLILGLIWTIILRFQIQRYLFGDGAENSTGQSSDVHDSVDAPRTATTVGSGTPSGPSARPKGPTRPGESREQASVKQALLAWSNNTLKGYDVEVKDFGNSWRDGLAFNGLVHKARPDLFDFDALDKNSRRENLARAFDFAEKELNIPKLLDPEDVDTDYPDDRSIMTYVSSYYHYFAVKKKEQNEGKRLAKVSFKQSHQLFHFMCQSLLLFIISNASPQRLFECVACSTVLSQYCVFLNAHRGGQTSSWRSNKPLNSAHTLVSHAFT